MGGRCPEGRYWDTLVKDCLCCGLVCRQPYAISKCVSYCESARCRELPGHYYDVLLKKCVTCAEICGKHPAECSQHCRSETRDGFHRDLTAFLKKATPPPATTDTLAVKVTSRQPGSRGASVPMALEDSTLLLYSLLALCMVLLFSSLALALAVLLRTSRAKSSKDPPKEAKQKPGETDSARGGQPGHTSTDFATGPSCPPNREQSDDSLPTETCACVHCFPDLKAPGQSSDRPLGPLLSLIQHHGLPAAQTAKGSPLWTEQSLRGPGGGSSAIRPIYSSSNRGVPQQNWNG